MKNKIKSVDEAIKNIGDGAHHDMRNLLHENTLSGVTDFMNSLLGAMGISIGVSLALLTFGEDVLQHIQGQEIVQSQIVQTIASICGGIGFAVVFNCNGKVLILSGIGAAFTWTIYRLTLVLADDNYFTATLLAACGAAIFAHIVAVLIKKPPAIFQTTCIFLLIPGSTFYLLVYSIITDDQLGYHENGRRLFLICIGIALGYIIVEMMYKYIRALILLAKRPPQDPDKTKDEDNLSV